MAGVKAVLAHFCGSVQFGVFLEHHAQGPFRFTHISIFVVVVAVDVIDRATLSFLQGLILGVNTINHITCNSDPKHNYVGES